MIVCFVKSVRWQLASEVKGFITFAQSSPGTLTMPRHLPGVDKLASAVQWSCPGNTSSSQQTTDTLNCVNIWRGLNVTCCITNSELMFLNEILVITVHLTYKNILYLLLNPLVYLERRIWWNCVDINIQDSRHAFWCVFLR